MYRGLRPNLRFLGFLVPGMQEPEIIGSTVLPSVQVLAIQVKLGTRTKATAVPRFLGYFPNTETLYVHSEDDDIHQLSWDPLTSIRYYQWQRRPSRRPHPQVLGGG